MTKEDKNKTAVGVFDKLAAVYQEKFMDVSLYKETLDFFCNSIAKPDPEILEIACGPGNITKYLLNNRPGFKILGIDLSPNMISLAKINNPSANFQLMDGRDISMINKKYDAIMCGFFLPYLPKEETEKLISDAATLLKPQGIFYLSTMEDDYSKSGIRKGSSGDEIFMHFYKADYLVDVLEKNDFTLLKLDRKIYTSPDGTETTDLIILAIHNKTRVE